MQRRSKSGAILLELIIVILFFALSAATILQVYAAAYDKSRTTSRRDIALEAAQDWAEQFIGQTQPHQLMTEAGWQQNEDGSLEMVTGEGVVLRADFDEVMSDAGTLHQMTITALDKGEQVFELPVAVYSAEEVERQ